MKKAGKPLAFLVFVLGPSVSLFTFRNSGVIWMRPKRRAGPSKGPSGTLF